MSRDISSSNSTFRRIFLTVPSNLQALARVLDWFNQYSPLLPSKEDWEKCRIALAEGFTNAVKHAHHHLPSDTPIELEAVCRGGHIELRIWDQGEPFDLDQYLTRLSPHSSQEAESGRGLRLIREIADQFEYERMPDGRNCLYIVKLLQCQPSGRLVGSSAGSSS